jgi:hypothetical protein
VLLTQRLTSPCDFDREQAPAFFGHLLELGWTPAIFQSEHAFNEMAGLPTSRTFRTPPRTTREWDEVRLFGDVFFRDSSLYYLIHSPERRVPAKPIRQGRS